MPICNAVQALLVGMAYGKVSYMSEQKTWLFWLLRWPIYARNIDECSHRIGRGIQQVQDDPDFVRELEDLHKKLYRSSIPFILCRTHDKDLGALKST